MSVDFAKDWERTTTRLDNLILFDLFFLKHFSYLPNLNNFSSSIFLYFQLFYLFHYYLSFCLILK